MPESVWRGASGFSSKYVIRPSSSVSIELYFDICVEVADVVDGEQRRAPLAREVAEVREIRPRKVVARDDDEVVVDLLLLDHEADVADRAEPVFVARRAVVDHRHVAPAFGPLAELRREPRVRDDVASRRRRPARATSSTRSTIGLPPTGSSAFGRSRVSG